MFFKKTKKSFLLLLLTLYIIPFNILAYSDYIIASGENIGIKLNTDGIIIAGTYEINGINPAKDAGLKEGDIIISIDNIKVNNINNMVNAVSKSTSKKLSIKYLRNNKENSTVLKLVNDKETYKTGLYVKDTVSGIGTLTFIDPNTKLFGALGHEISDNKTGKIIEIIDGEIFKSKVTNIVPSRDGNPGEKNATLYTDLTEGKVYENTNKGIFGKYTKTINTSKLYKVAKINDIKKGSAKILTVLNDDDVNEYSINITKVSNTKDKVKNIVFEITDEKLLNKTNGIVQGMSGSPIIQGDYIIGAVTHVVVENPQKGYGIIITNMLEEAEN